MRAPSSSTLPRRPRRAAPLLAVLATAALAGCIDLLVDPTPGPPAGVAVVFQVAQQSPGEAGPADAFDRADAVRVRVTRAQGPALERVLALPPTGATRRVGPLSLQMQQPREEVELAIDLLQGEAVLFRAVVEGVELRAGRTAEVPVSPVAVPGGVRLPDAVSDLTSLGDTLQLSGTVVFATGEAIPGLALAWSTPDASIVEVSPQGRVVSLAEGDARVVGEFGAFADTLLVRVRPVVATITLLPASAAIGIDETVQLAATLRDARGNVLRNRSVESWVSSHPARAEVDGNGLVRGMAPGEATITASSQGASGAAVVTVTVSDEPGTVTGRVVDAIAGTPLAGASVDFGGGHTTTTAGDGGFALDLPPGDYGATISAPGYASASVPGITVVPASTTELGTVALSPVLAEGELRIVLTWQVPPNRDLDAHLTGPRETSPDRFHVFYASRGSLVAPPHAYLDRDDLVGPGPETITISRLFAGTYRYSVHDYTGRNSTNTSALANTDARVRVYRGDDQVADYTVPNQPGTLWTVFEVNGATGEITPINTMAYHGNPGTIQRLGREGAAPPGSSVASDEVGPVKPRR